MRPIHPFVYATLLSVALIFAIHFNGTSINLLYLTLSCFFLLVTAMLTLTQYALVLKQCLAWRRPHSLAAFGLVWIFISSQWSQAPTLSWHYSWVIACLPFGFLLGSFIAPLCRITLVWHCLMGVILFYALWAIVEFLQAAHSSHGPMIYQGNFGALFVAPAISLIAAQGFIKQPRCYYYLGLAILLTALFSTYSRSSLLSLLLILPLLFFSAYRQGYAWLKPALTVSVLLLISGALVAVYAQYTGGQLMADKAVDIQNAASISARSQLWHSTLAIYQDYPWLGSGLAGFKLLYPAYRDPSEISSGMFSHNDYLQILQEGGPVLLLMLLLPLVLLAKIYWQATAKGKPSTMLFSAGGYALASATFFIHAGADFIFYNQALALLAGLLAGFAYQTCYPVAQPATAWQQPRVKLVLTGSVALLLFIRLALDTLIYTHLEPQQLFGRSYQPKPDAQTLLTYHALRPEHLSPLTHLADLYFFMVKQETDSAKKSAYGKTAIALSGDILTLSPGYYHYYFQLAALLHNNPEFTPAVITLMNRLDMKVGNNPEEQLLQKTLKLDPTFKKASLALAYYYQSHKQDKLALQVLQEARRWFEIDNFHSSEQHYQQEQLDKLQIDALILVLAESKH